MNTPSQAIQTYHILLDRETSSLFKLREDYATGRIELEELEQRVWLVLQGQGYLQSGGDMDVDPLLINYVCR